MEGVPCAINSIDVGIAIGSACATAADMRVDTRVMFSAGLAATPELAERLQNGYGNSCKCILQESVFDRKPKQETKA